MRLTKFVKVGQRIGVLEQNVMIVKNEMDDTKKIIENDEIGKAE